jgi:HK97 family phage prohead protease
MFSKVKALSDGSVYFEGYANKAVVDRGGDLIGKKAWQLDNYKKNPIVLFNHDHSKPIGKMINIEAKDDGLYVKGRISNSKDPEISRIRDLVEEGILNSMSVGMRVMDEERKGEVNHIKACELHECSIVSVPMNQDSTISASVKTMSQPLNKIMEAITEGRSISKVFHRLHGNSFSDLAKELSQASGLSVEKSLDFLKLKTEETPKEVKDWMEKEIQAILVPKDMFDNHEALGAWASDNGYSMENLSETDTHFVLGQKPAESFEETEQVEMDGGLSAIVGKIKAEEDLASQFQTEAQQAVAGEEGNPPSWVTDEALWEKAKEVSQSALGEVSYAFVVWYYMKEGGSKKSCMDDKPEEKGLLDDQNPMTVPLEPATHADTEVNPSLDQMKQSNVLLASIVQLLQAMNERLAPPEQNLPPPGVNATFLESGLEKKVEDFAKRMHERLKVLGV